MTSENRDRKPHSLAPAIYRFLAGAAVAAFTIFIPVSFYAHPLTPLQFALAFLLVIFWGLLSSLLGEKFIEALTKALTSSGF